MEDIFDRCEKISKIATDLIEEIERVKEAIAEEYKLKDMEKGDD